MRTRCTPKAIEAAITARQWSKAIQIVDTQDSEVAKKYYKRIARHYEESKSHVEAEQAAPAPVKAARLVCPLWPAPPLVALRLRDRRRDSRGGQVLLLAGRARRTEKKWTR